MALGLHLEHPPPRTVSLQRSREIHSLSNQRHITSAPDAFISSLEFSTPTSCPPILYDNGWTTTPREMVELFDIISLDFPSPVVLDDIPLPSTPTTPRFHPVNFPGVNMPFELDVDGEIDIQIPLMTSLFYDDGGCAISFPRDRPSKTLPRRGDLVCSEIFPRDVDAFSTWGTSPASTPRPTTPCFSPMSVPPPLESDHTMSIGIEQPSTGCIEPPSRSQELTRLQTKRRRQAPALLKGTGPRRLPQPPVSSRQDASAQSIDLVGAPASPQANEVIVGTNEIIIPPSKPKFRPLPPTPLAKPASPMKDAARALDGSSLSISSPRAVVDNRVSLDLYELVDIVDDMINGRRLSSFTIGEIGPVNTVPPLRHR